MGNIRLLLIDDQELAATVVQEMIADEDVLFAFCSNPTFAIEIAERFEPTVVLQDLMMPQMDGLVLLKYLKAHKKLQHVPLIVLSADDNPETKAKAFELGASDYMVKLPDKREFCSRIRHQHLAYLEEVKKNEILEAALVRDKKMTDELTAASSYLRALLPAPTKGKISIDWHYIPSIRVGGDFFFYTWLDKKTFIMYILDVSGHGIKASLYVSSIIHFMRHLLETKSSEIAQPKSLLEMLNKEFPMEKNDNLFFSMFYGVYDADKKVLQYANAGHPPGVLFQENSTAILLSATGIPLGVDLQTQFQEKRVSISSPSRLYLFTDGVYEVMKKTGKGWSLDDVVNMLQQKEVRTSLFEDCTNNADDVSLLEIDF